MNERLKTLRKSLKLSQEEFGSRIGISGGAISLLEKGTRNFTEQVIKSICREFNVEYLWFTIGKGEMFCATDDNIMAQVDNIMHGEPTFLKNLIKTFVESNPDDMAALERLIDKYLEIKNKTD